MHRITLADTTAWRIRGESRGRRTRVRTHSRRCAHAALPRHARPSARQRARRLRCRRAPLRARRSAASAAVPSRPARPATLHRGPGRPVRRDGHSHRHRPAGAGSSCRVRCRRSSATTCPGNSRRPDAMAEHPQRRPSTSTPSDFIQSSTTQSNRTASRQSGVATFMSDRARVSADGHPLQEDTGDIIRQVASRSCRSSCCVISLVLRRINISFAKLQLQSQTSASPIPPMVSARGLRDRLCALSKCRRRNLMPTRLAHARNRSRASSFRRGLATTAMVFVSTNGRATGCASSWRAMEAGFARACCTT